jgi:hypothetical protein
VAEAWASYEREVIPDTAGATQRKESRRAFYAGASAMFRLVGGVGIDDISEDQGAAMIERLHLELHAFARDLREARA